MLFLAGTVDVANAVRAKMVLSQAVASGANYSCQLSQMYPDRTVNVSDISAATRAGAPAGSTASVVVTLASCVVNGTLQPASSQPDSAKCPNGLAPGDYQTISATYHYDPILPLYSLMASSDLTESVIVRTK